MLEAKFYDISSYIDPNYDKYEHVRMNKKEFADKIKLYLESHKEIKEADILFVGNDYESRQEYGFCIVLNNDIKMENYGPYLPIKYKNNLPSNISYASLLNIMKNDDYLYSLWYGDDADTADETIQIYKDKNLY